MSICCSEACRHPDRYRNTPRQHSTGGIFWNICVFILFLKYTSPVLITIYHLEIANEVLWEGKRSKVKLKIFKEDVLNVKLKCDEDIENIRQSLTDYRDERGQKRKSM